MRQRFFGGNMPVAERHLLLAGRMAALQIREVKRLSTLADAEFCVTSQFGEDGIIDWLISALPDTAQSFIELGVESYSEANTRFLLQNRGWRGLIVDGNDKKLRIVRSSSLYWMFDLTALTAFVTAENVNSLVEDSGFSGEIGLLSIDIDGNDYWVLDKLDVVSPAILVIEFNGAFGDLHALTVPYSSSFSRFAEHPSGQYFGASIMAIIDLATSKGFDFVGTTSSGINAFFVRRDLSHLVTSRIETIKMWPPRHRDVRDEDGRLTYTAGMARVEPILGKQVYDVRSAKMVDLGSLVPLYSPSW
jgi:hypothetical protein